MSGQAQTVLRWGACLALVLGLHVAAALTLLRRDPRPEPPPLAPDAVMLELAPDAVATAPVPAPSPEPQPEPEPQPDPEPPSPELPPQPEPAPQAVPPAVPVPDPPVIPPEPPPPPPPPKRPPPPPRPAARPPRPAQASPPQQAAETPAPSAAAPTPAPAPALPTAAPSSAVPGWRSELAGRLQRAKRYPDAARARDEQGAAAVRFTIDRSGHVLSVGLVRSSGSAALDEEAVALVRRAEPLPPMPADMPGDTITLTVPVSFSLR